MEEFICNFDSSEKLLKDINTLCIFNFSEKSNDSRSHCHECWEIGYTLYGKGTFHINGECFDISTGDLVLVEPGTSHYESCSENTSVEILFLMFNSNFSPYKSFGLTFKNSIILNTCSLPEIEHILRSILVEATEQRQGFDRFITAEITRLFISIYRLSNNEATSTILSQTLPAAASLRKTKIVNEIKKYMDESLGNNLNIGDIAARFYFSPQHLVRVFKDVTGKTPKDYETEIKIKKAMSLLQKQEEVSLIAEVLGYTSIHHFYRVFKNETGMTPLQYKEKQGLK